MKVSARRWQLVVWAAAAMIALAFGAGAFGSDKWMQKEYTSWTDAQAEQMLSNSPWARRAGAEIVVPKEDPETKDIPLARPANVPNPGPSYNSDAYGVDDGQWDGGVAGKARRGDPEKLPVLVRWDSARPVRGALLRTHAPELVDTESTLVQPEKDYVISVSGLVPARKAAVATDDDDRHASGAAPFDATAIRQAVASTARLARPGKKPLLPEDVHLDEKTGTLQIYFPKTEPITLNDKAVLFRLTYGTLRVEQAFRLKDMTVDGQLEL